MEPWHRGEGGRPTLKRRGTLYLWGRVTWGGGAVLGGEGLADAGPQHRALLASPCGGVEGPGHHPKLLSSHVFVNHACVCTVSECLEILPAQEKVCFRAKVVYRPLPRGVL